MELLGNCHFIDGGTTLSFGDMGEVQNRAGIDSDRCKWVAFKTERGLLIVPEERVGLTMTEEE